MFRDVGRDVPVLEKTLCQKKLWADFSFPICWKVQLLGGAGKGQISQKTRRQRQTLSKKPQRTVNWCLSLDTWP